MYTDPQITTEFYAHLSPGYLRSAIDRLAINPNAPEDLPAAATAIAVAPSAAPADAPEPRPLLHPCCRPANAPESAADRSRKPASLRRLRAERDIGFEPTTFSLGICVWGAGSSLFGPLRSSSDGWVPLFPTPPCPNLATKVEWTLAIELEHLPDTVRTAGESAAAAYSPSS